MPDTRERRPIVGREDAERFLQAFSTAVDDLQAVTEQETADLSAGRVRLALGQESRKSELAAAYLQGLEQVRANAVALARFAPDAAARLREKHGAFRAAIERNQTVIATARAISEGLVRGVAEEMARNARPAGYGAVAPARGGSTPMVLSRRF